MSDIRDWGKFIRGRWDWESFGYEKGFPRKCAFSDVDAVVEFDGRTLFIETKAYDGEGELPEVPGGQHRLLEHLAEQPDTTVLLLYGCGCCNAPYAVKDKGTGVFYDWRGMATTARRRELKLLIDKAMGV